jgi:hypothetical protein
LQSILNLLVLLVEDDRSASYIAADVEPEEPSSALDCSTMASRTDPEKDFAISPANADVAPSSSTSSDLDDNYDLYKQQIGIESDPAEAKRVLRKIDLRVVPVLFVIYLLQYLDKNGINYASAYGLQKGTHLQGQDYSWLSSIVSLPASG